MEQSSKDDLVKWIVGLAAAGGFSLIGVYFSQTPADRERGLLVAGGWLLGSAVLVGVFYFMLWPTMAWLSSRRAIRLEKIDRSRRASARHGLEILHANYGANGALADVTTLVRGYVTNNRLNVEVTNQTMGGDPIVNVPKQLQVKYAVDGVEDTRSFAEGSTASLPPVQNP